MRDWCTLQRQCLYMYTRIKLKPSANERKLNSEEIKPFKLSSWSLAHLLKPLASELASYVQKVQVFLDVLTSHPGRP